MADAGRAHEPQEGGSKKCVRKKCEHGRQKSYCKECGGSAFCEHGRRKSRCKDCGGSEICEHGRRKSECKECGGSSICEHGRRKSQCKECGGSAFCEHGRQKSYCKECGGSSICEHRRIKKQCKECGGSSICEHGRRKSRCKECGGASICEHGRQKNECKECGGSSICEHGREKSKCKECGGSSICGHERIKSQCKECGGSSICEHRRIKSRCKECGGASICKHGRNKSTCKECLPIEKLVSSKLFCIACFALLSKKRQRTRRCAGCEATCPRTEENVRELLLKLLRDFPPSSIDDHGAMLGGAACQQERKARPDIAWHTERATVIFECDEDSHSSPSYCDAYTPARSSGLAEAVHRVRGKLVPVFIVGMNPDAFDGARVKFESRVEHAANLVRSLLTHPCPAEEYDPRVPHVWLLYYHSKSERHVNACREAHARGQLFFHESVECTSSVSREYSDEELDESEVDE